jgi:hypothetical protein
MTSAVTIISGAELLPFSVLEIEAIAGCDGETALADRSAAPLSLCTPISYLQVTLIALH